MAEGVSQSRFRHVFQRDPKIGSNPVDAFADLLLSITSKVIAAEVVGRKGHVRGDLAGQASLIERHTDNHADAVTFAGREELLFRVLLENIVDDLDRIEGAVLD